MVNLVVSVTVVTAMGDIAMYYEHGHWDGGTRGTYSVLLKLYGHILGGLIGKGFARDFLGQG